MGFSRPLMTADDTPAARARSGPGIDRSPSISSTTVRAARDFGYRSTLVASACATRDLPFGDQLIPAAQVQQISLAELADNFAMVVSDVDALQ